jgi:hypothetical protein
MPLPLLATAVVLAVVSFLLARAALGATRDRRLGGGAIRALVAALFLALAALCATVSVAVRGYAALTHEVLAATVKTEPIGAQRFRATILLADGSLKMFDVTGDQVYVDAHILKWHPWVNLLGLHTGYELDRIGGRYETLAEERAKPRTLESLAPDRVVDLFDVARRYKLLRPLVDAQYGSATFIGAREPAIFEIRVSTTGLLVRRVPLPKRPAL